MKYLSFLISGLLLITTSCSVKKTQESDNNNIVYILSEQEDCMQSIEMTCFQYKSSPESEEILVYEGTIEGFEYEDSHNYLLEIEKQEDGENEKWVLKNVLKKTYDENAYMIPEKITAVFYENARIKMDASTQYYARVLPGSSLVMELKRTQAYDRRVADALFTETIIVEVNNKEGDFVINGADEAVLALYGKACFCEYSGLAYMKDFKLKASKSGEGYDVSIQVPAQEMDLINMGNTLKNIPYVREQRDFAAEFEQKSVMKMLEENMSAEKNPYQIVAGIWELEQINDRNMQDIENDWDTPTIEIRVDELIYAGNDGCNLINGNMVIEGTSIFFEHGISTRKYCEKSIDTEFGEAFFSINNYKLVADRLLLRKDQRTLMVLKRK